MKLSSYWATVILCMILAFVVLIAVSAMVGGWTR
jgi:hypothetical protein